MKQFIKIIQERCGYKYDYWDPDLFDWFTHSSTLCLFCADYFYIWFDPSRMYTNAGVRVFLYERCYRYAPVWIGVLPSWFTFTSELSYLCRFCGEHSILWYALVSSSALPDEDRFGLLIRFFAAYAYHWVPSFFERQPKRAFSTLYHNINNVFRFLLEPGEINVLSRQFRPYQVLKLLPGVSPRCEGRELCPVESIWIYARHYFDQFHLWYSNKTGKQDHFINLSRYCSNYLPLWWNPNYVVPVDKRVAFNYLTSYCSDFFPIWWPVVRLLARLYCLGTSSLYSLFFKCRKFAFVWLPDVFNNKPKQSYLTCKEILNFAEWEDLL